MADSRDWSKIKALDEKACKGKANPYEKENTSSLDYKMELGILTNEELDLARETRPFALIESVARSISLAMPDLGPCHGATAFAGPPAGTADAEHAVSGAAGAEKWRNMIFVILKAVAAGTVHPGEEPASSAIRAGMQKQLITLQEREEAVWAYYQNEHVQRHLLLFVADGSENPERLAIKLSIEEGVRKGHYTEMDVQTALEAHHLSEAMGLLDSVSVGMLYPDSGVLNKLEGYVSKNLITKDDIHLALEGFHSEKNKAEISDAIRRIKSGRLDPNEPDVRARLTAALAAGIITPEIVKAAAESYKNAVLAASLREVKLLGFVIGKQKSGMPKRKLLN